MTHVFVSHVSADRPEALRIVEALERNGVRCWIAPRDVRPGPFDDEIVAAIEGCAAMVLVFSARCNTSEYIRREVTVAGESKKIIVPFRIEDVQPQRGLRVRLSDLHWIDGFVSRERGIDDLVKALALSVSEGDAASIRKEIASDNEQRLNNETWIKNTSHSPMFIAVAIFVAISLAGVTYYTFERQRLFPVSPPGAGEALRPTTNNDTPLPQFGGRQAPASGTSSNIDDLDLQSYVADAARALVKAHPGVVFVSGRRSVRQQASFMAGNVASNRQWIATTYRPGPEENELQNWVDSNPTAITRADIVDAFEKIMSKWTEEQRRALSTSYSGESFQIMPIVGPESDKVKSTIRSLPYLKAFVEKSGGVNIWRLDFSK